MSTYREIHGKAIKSVTTDPSAATDEGQVWYNTNSSTFKSIISTEAWSSASALNTAVYYNCGAGDQTAALSFQGTAGPNPSTSTQTEEYNGSGWATGGATPVAKRSGMGAGTQTAALSAGGATAPGTASTSVDEYNGTAWTSANALSVGRRYTAGCGTQTAAICTGGQNPGGTQIDSTEEYDGTNWTSGGAWPKTIRQEVLLGTQTATLGAGGYSTTTEVEAYEYDGSSWTATGDMNQQRYVFQGFGTQTVGIVCGGEPAPDAATKTESYNGATFSTSPATLGNPTAQAASGVASPGTAGIVFGDAAGGTAANTEEYNKSANVITAGAWASSGGLGTARYQIGGAGDVPAGLAFGGYGTSIPGNTNKSEEYNGATWTAGNNMNNPRGQCSGQHIGTQTAALAAGGTLTTLGPPNYGTACEEYDGTNWTATGALNTGRSYTAGFGTQTAGVAATGSTSPATAASEEYDGSSWTSGNSANTARYGAAGTGILTAGVIVGNYPGTGNVEEYDGTNWTTVTSYPAGRFGINAGSGTQTDCIYSGGSNGTTRTTETFGYDGTSWSTRPSLGNALSSCAAGGTSSSAFIAGGRGSPPGPTAGVTTCEEFTGETTAVNVKTLTQG